MAIFIFALLLTQISFAANDFHVDAGGIQVVHNRPDLRVEKLWISWSCFNQDGSWAANDCVDVKAGGEPAGDLIAFQASSKVKDYVPTSRLDFQINAKSEKIFCVGLKVLFEGFPNQEDYVLYSDLRDRYSILSFCNIDELPEPMKEQPRVSHRRARDWAEFRARFAQPIELRLVER